MQEKSIPLELKYFITDKLYHQNFIPKNSFELLGNPLKEWLKKLLDHYEVPEQGQILSKVSSKAEITGRVYIEEGCKVEPYSYIQGPAFIGKGTEIRHGAYLRGNTYIGPNCVVGHTTEVKESVFFDHAKAGHFAYVGNSILGRHVNLGAGTKLANLKLRKNLVRYQNPETKKINCSGLKKFGAILGDYCQTGCNSVISPGSLLLPHATVLPCEHFHGTKTK